VESGEWRVESGEWRVESGEWRVESGEKTKKRHDDHAAFLFFVVRIRSSLNDALCRADGHACRGICITGTFGA